MNHTFSEGNAQHDSREQTIFTETELSSLICQNRSSCFQLKGCSGAEMVLYFQGAFQEEISRSYIPDLAELAVSISTPYFGNLTCKYFCRDDYHSLNRISFSRTKFSSTIIT